MPEDSKVDAPARQVRNPLTLIAIFAGLSETAATAVLPLLTGTVQLVFVWYVMLFPTLLVILFFRTLNRNHRVLYAPSDYRDERLFVEQIQSDYAAEDESARRLRGYWKPDGNINKLNQERLRKWLLDNGLGDATITIFLTSPVHAAARTKAAEDLGLHQ